MNETRLFNNKIPTISTFFLTLGGGGFDTIYLAMKKQKSFSKCSWLRNRVIRVKIMYKRERSVLGD